jgi:hypothetical protein
MGKLCIEYRSTWNKSVRESHFLGYLYDRTFHLLLVRATAIFSWQCSKTCMCFSITRWTFLFYYFLLFNLFILLNKMEWGKICMSLEAVMAEIIFVGAVLTHHLEITSIGLSHTNNSLQMRFMFYSRWVEPQNITLLYCFHAQVVQCLYANECRHF